jgi:hypothetical protein
MIIKSLGFWVAVLLALYAPAALGLDPIELFQNGDSTDILAAGLALPGEFASSPDPDRPLSLLRFPSSITADFKQSAPWRETGAAPRHLQSNNPAGTLLIHPERKTPTPAFALSLDNSRLSFHEDGKEWTRAEAQTNRCRIAFAQQWRSLRAGITLDKSKQEGDVRSTRLAGIETQPGSGVGRLAWRLPADGFTVEAAKSGRRTTTGLLASWAGGNIQAHTRTGDQDYFAYQNTDVICLMPYHIWLRDKTTNMLLLSGARSEMSGPLTVGRLEAGETEGRWQDYSLARVWRRAYDRGEKMSSVEFTDTIGKFSGDAGGFLFPGLFNAPQATDDRFRFQKISLRCGVESRRGRTSFRVSAHLAGGLVDGRFYATKSRWPRPPKVLTNKRLDRAGLWFFSPAVGLGYQGNSWGLEAGGALYGAYLTKTFHSRDGGGSGSGGSGEGEGNRFHPGVRWSLVLRKDF